MRRFLLLLLLVSLNSEAKHLGTFGETFNILEEDLLEVITQKLKSLESSGELVKQQSLIQEKMKEKVQRPTPVAGITHTKISKEFTYDPSLTVPYDLKDHNGIIFVKAGTRVNPLDSHQLSKTLLFIDGDDEPQVHWAMQQEQDKHKIILVKGQPFKLMDLHSRTFYFDQGGHLVKKLGITQVPARVRQKGKVLKIEELKIEGGGT
jgi:conjugal transfer pilus assembly protein TraW